MRICFEYLCLLFLFRTIHCDSPEPEPNKTTDYELFEQNRDVRSIADATVATIRGFYVNHTSVLSISRGSSNSLSYQKQSEILNRILLSTSTEISYTIEEPGHLKAAARVFNLFFVDGLDGFGRIFEEFSVKYFNKAGFYTIVLTERVEQPHEMIKSIFTDLWSRHVINANVLSFEDFGSGSSVYTFFPFSENHCDEIWPVLWDYFADGHFTRNKEIFATKLDNFHGCPITMGTYNLPPYMILTRHPNGTVSPRTDGIEGVLFQVLSQTMNFRPVVIEIKGKYLDSRLYFDMLRNNEINMTMYAMVNTMERSSHFTATFPHHHASVVVSHVLSIPFTSIQRLMLPFQLTIWIVFICTLAFAFNVIYIILIYCSDRQSFIFGRANHAPFLNTINISLGGSIMRPPTRNFARTLFAFWLFGTLVLRNSYQGALFEFLHSQKSAEDLDTLEKLADYNCLIYATPQVYKTLWNDSCRLRNSLRNFDGSFNIMETQKTQQPPGVFIASLDTVEYHNSLHAESGFLIPSRRRIFLLPLSIFFRKHSCLAPAFNTRIETLQSSGLIQLWSRMYRKMSFYHQAKQNEPKQLSFEQVGGIYIIAAYLYAISLFVFFVELLSLQMRFLRILFKHL